MADVPGEATTVTSKGQVTIPKAIRQRLGIRKGSRVYFTVSGDHAELRLVAPAVTEPSSGFGMLKSRRKAVPADFDPATLLHDDREE